jgi:hypothetical protein
VFTVEQRDALRERLLQLAEEDDRVVAAAAVGSLAVGAGDEFSDLDLTFGVADHVAVAEVVAARAVHAFGCCSGRRRAARPRRRRRAHRICSGGVSSMPSTRARASSEGVSGRRSTTSEPSATTHSRSRAFGQACRRSRPVATTISPRRRRRASMQPTWAVSDPRRCGRPLLPRFSRCSAKRKSHACRTRMPSFSGSRASSERRARGRSPHVPTPWGRGPFYPLGLAGTNRLTKSSAVSATSCQPWSIVREWPRLGIFWISVTPGLRFCRL